MAVIKAANSRPAKIDRHSIRALELIWDKAAFDIPFTSISIFGM